MTTVEEEAAQGFLRFPNAWLRLPLSPGAKCLLMQFCAAADAEGVSWYSYAQLGEIVNRSRASVAAYVSELREAGVIDTERQRAANGFNYRLRVQVVGWRAMTEAWRPLSARRKTERGVRCAERKNPTGSKTQINENQTQVDAISYQDNKTIFDKKNNIPCFNENHEKEWRRCLRHPDDAAFDKTPSDALLEAVITHAERLAAHHAPLTRDEAAREAEVALRAFTRRHGLSSTETAISEGAAVLAHRLRTEKGIAASLETLGTEWPKHWRRLSTPAQLSKWLEAKLAENTRRFEDLSELWRFRNRALRAREELRRRARATPYNVSAPKQLERALQADAVIAA